MHRLDNGSTKKNGSPLLNFFASDLNIDRFKAFSFDGDAVSGQTLNLIERAQLDNLTAKELLALSQQAFGFQPNVFRLNERHTKSFVAKFINITAKNNGFAPVKYHLLGG